MTLPKHPRSISAMICMAIAWTLHPACADEFPTPENTEKSTTTPMPPEEVVQSAKLPPGFELSRIAAEPRIRNPIAFTTDERGRLWVAENYSWAGAGRGGFDPAQRDRIVILEDSNADGTYDKRTVFWDQAHNLTSIEVGYGGVWAICLPELIFLPDQNRDDVPDGEPMVILDGFDPQASSHTPANGLKWGPDGWLYGRHGILATSHVGKPGQSESQRFDINTGIWRYHPTRDVAEAVMHGMTNPWGFDFDQYGEMFCINTVIGHLWHVVPGAHTERMFGLDLNPHTYELIGQVADHVHWDEGEGWSDVRKGVTDKTSAAGGGHAHIGLMIYQADNWPAEYRNRAYMLNLHGRRINADILKRKGAGYTASHGPDMCFIADPWFRGMDLITGPDGGVFIIDWSDTGECHDHDGVNYSSGRIYKLSYGQPSPLPPFDLTKQSEKQLISHLSHPNAWWARQAQRILTERATQGHLPVDRQKSLAEVTEAMDPSDVRGIQDLLKRSLRSASDPVVRVRILQTIASAGGTSADWWIDRLVAENEYERVTALKALVDQSDWKIQSPSATILNTLTGLAANDRSGLMLLHLASTLQQLPVDLRWDIATALAARNEFAQDRMFPLMIWYGIEPAIPRSPKRALHLIQTAKIPLVTELVARRMTLEIERDPESCNELLEVVLSGQCPFPERVISGMAEALNGWQQAPAPANWSKVAAAYGKSDSELIRNQVQSLNVVFGDGRAIEEIRQIVTDDSRPADARQQALRALMTSHPADFAPTLMQLLDDKVMVVEALRGLAQYDNPEIPQRILARAARFRPIERAEMIETLTSRPSFAKALLGAIRRKQLDSSILSAFHARRIASFEDAGLTRDLTELWGNVRATDTEKRELIASYRSRLTTDVLAQADLSAGRALFQKTCASCHVLFGSGRKLGPDLTGSNRKNLDYLLENIIDPSASVGADFRSVVVALSDGRVLNGVVSAKNERTLTLQSADDTLTLDRKEIEQMRTTNVSLMPEGQLQKLTPEQTRDLIGYLMSTNQVPLPTELSKEAAEASGQ